MKIVSRVVVLVMSVVALVFMSLLTKLDILPNKYYLPCIILISVFLFLLGIILWKKNTGIVGRVVAFLFAFLFTFSMSAGIYYMDTTLRFMKQARAIKEEESIYYVLVHKEAPYETIEDLQNQEVVSFMDKSSSYKKAVTQLKEKITYHGKESIDLKQMGNQLLNRKVEALLIGEQYKELLEEENKDFKDQVKILYSISIKNKIEGNEETVSMDEAFSVYISGIDTYGNIKTASRSDVNIVMTIQPKTHEILLTSIPRDYYVQLHGTTGTKDKLTHAGIYGIEMSRKTVEDLLHTDIPYYVRVNFDTLIKVIDVIGGIDVYSDRNFPYKNVTIVKGMNHMDGKAALTFARERKLYAEGDRRRGENQQAVIEAIIKKGTSSKTILTKYADILHSMEETFQTNMEQKVLTEFVKRQVDDMRQWTVHTYNLDGYNSSNITYSMGNMRLYVMEPDPNTLTRARMYLTCIKDKKKIKKFSDC